MQSGSEKKAIVFYCAPAELQRSSDSVQRSADPSSPIGYAEAGSGPVFAYQLRRGRQRTVISGRSAVTSVFWLLFLIIGLLFFANNARGDIVRVNLNGEVTSVVDPAGLLGGQVNVIDAVTGFYRFDTSTPDSKPLNSNEGEYQQTPGCGISLDIGGMLFASNPNPQSMNFLIKVINDTDSNDSYLLSSTVNLPIAGGLAVSSIHWQLEDKTCSALCSDALVAATPGQWDYNVLDITFRGAGGAGRIEAIITYTESVPEPASVLTITLGILFIGGRRSKKQISKIKYQICGRRVI
jgi:hypothetical protein